ncbi:hypothetical protein PF008_g27786 [Phytophthora fragariae]|uniref:ZSWIM1/3 RNaseH-like domain-containing protein n=1 Tax=Phytophthora fragariae TaxID=53985 RepID=A0A6G0QD73_9STRA|nr:hypothetical protein PF008_g27786 [Phytophthora fragariae]
MFNHIFTRLVIFICVLCVKPRIRYNYQLCTLMTMDQFGNGQAVQHSVIGRNADWHMVNLIEHFQSVNAWQGTKVIMVHKDLNEIDDLKRMFPDARILFCHFHVIKWLRGAIRNDKRYGTYPINVLKQMDFCVANMVYSKATCGRIQKFGLSW